MGGPASPIHVPNLNPIVRFLAYFLIGSLRSKSLRSSPRPINMYEYCLTYPPQPRRIGSSAVPAARAATTTATGFPLGKLGGTGLPAGGATDKSGTHTSRFRVVPWRQVKLTSYQVPSAFFGILIFLMLWDSC